ncbi:MAG: hypothetical protein ACTJLM_04950 [Ehrlichia sp.]
MFFCVVHFLYLILGDRKNIKVFRNKLIIKKVNHGVFVVSQDQSPVGGYTMFTFVNYAWKEWDKMNCVNDSMIKLEYINHFLVISETLKLQLDAHFKCEILVGGESLADVSDPYLCVWIEDRLKIENAIGKLSNYVRLCVKSFDVENGIVLLICDGCKVVRDVECLKLFLLEPYKNSGCSRYEVLLRILCSDYTVDPQFVCQKESEGFTTSRQGSFWLGMSYEQLAVYLLSICNPYEMLNRKKLYQSGQGDFDERIECLLSYVERNCITLDESSFCNLLNFVKACFFGVSR